jgi:hypothetical protein
MEGERCWRQVLHRHAKEFVYKVFGYFKREADAICTSLSFSLRHPPSFVSVSIPFKRTNVSALEPQPVQPLGKLGGRLGRQTSVRGRRQKLNE